ncbi:glutathione S-transferase C-terminal domain-containing protein [Burkholderia vietnamiensis]|uniref:glutathione S-transferase C-terminal domain-containing protein n=1 Tax=Burkholderia TaxID=32008 RepID=UPI0005D970FE|nr:glutathione S-transferase C-terminal domain-containing protein [Burkholderia vietnamiensis]AJY03996.1 glutathione S-transferase [Burkholderia vietnamiensis LMG 10929]AVR13356.1 glutathione S-transferase [Burkholderia vietnamiensis]KVF67508.1 glutathione S-transferase [Burkholderia vietnamiensis]KVM49744.1 glutathione S-transferase [Burkholderia vietnamiensis]KVR95539.1 glutathione S-transferase [Burkholderia vietnamiensis]
MKLYHAPGSCSQAICIVLREAQFDAQIVTVDARRHRFDDGRDYRAVNELGYVPLLVLDDGTTLREGPVIAQYLADRRPEAGLAPAYGALARYRLMEWLNFLGTEIHKGFIPLLYAVQAGKYVDPVRRKLDSRFAWIDRQLDGHTYLTGDTFTIADAYLFALTGWGKAGWLRSVYDADIDLSRHANLRSWYERVRARAAVQQVLQADGLANAA